MPVLYSDIPINLYLILWSAIRIIAPPAPAQREAQESEIPPNWYDSLWNVRKMFAFRADASRAQGGNNSYCTPEEIVQI